VKGLKSKNILTTQRNLRFAQEYESDGDSKFIKSNGSKSQATKMNSDLKKIRI
jgi:hypothetical protein